MRTHPETCGCGLAVPQNEVVSTPLILVSWVLRLVASGILLQTLYFKFSGAEESVYIFTRVGIEPWGRYATGAVELIAAILLLVPVTKSAGALLAIGLMLGAVGSHLTTLGIVVKNDGGLLFALAITVLVCSVGVAYIHRRQIPVVGNML